MTPVDLLVFGPHPDDLEIGMAGTVARHTERGVTVGLCDLTRGERGSNGTPEERVAESTQAAHVLGAAWRVNLELPDGGLSIEASNTQPIIDLIRGARPAIVAIPYGRDRHPDHTAAHALLARAVFDAGLRRVAGAHPAWRVSRIVQYFINDSDRPSFVVDVSGVYERKRAALACHGSQFAPAPDAGVATRLTSPLFAQLIESRDAQFGALAGVRFAEGFIVSDPVVVDDLRALGVQTGDAERRP